MKIKSEKKILIQIKSLNYKVSELINYIDFRIGEMIYYHVDFEKETLFVQMKNNYDIISITYMIEYFFTMEDIDSIKFYITETDQYKLYRRF